MFDHIQWEVWGHKYLFVAVTCLLINGLFALEGYKLQSLEQCSQDPCDNRWRQWFRSLILKGSKSRIPFETMWNVTDLNDNPHNALNWYDHHSNTTFLCWGPHSIPAYIMISKSRWLLDLPQFCQYVWLSEDQSLKEKPDIVKKYQYYHHISTSFALM